jgi:integrase
LDFWRDAGSILAASTNFKIKSPLVSATEAATRVSMDVISEFLGHTSQQMSKRYVKQNSDRLKGALRAVK